MSIPRNSGPVIGAAALGDPPGDAPTATVPGPGSRPPNAAVPTPARASAAAPAAVPIRRLRRSRRPYDQPVSTSLVASVS
ncbi:hypothetical protein ACFU7Y_11270 [Kitasatospora sp. NPDC057542]|uniref:hypothetical protein n=1 Tax=Kitasatospora sp. NPDC057542 TaxID=3346162 RepID=UPI0036A4DBBF